jgi:glycosyltransferase involved in cell wall biosynthesis
MFMTAVAAPPISSAFAVRSPYSASQPMVSLQTLQLGMSWFSEKPGGLERYFCELLQHLPEVGVQSRGLVVGSTRVSAESGGTVSAVATADAALWKRWHAMRRSVSSSLNDNQFDLVVSHHSLYTFPCLPLIKGIPFVAHFHGPYALESSAEKTRPVVNAIKHRMEQTAYSRAVRCITLSNAFATILHESYSVPRDRIRVIAGAVETLRFNPPETRSEAREKLGWPTDRPIAFSVRRLFRRMGLENLIEAVKTVKQRVPDILVLIAGKGWLSEELEQRIKSAGLEHHVKLLGFVPDADLPLAYRAADLTVVPTVSLEGFGLTTVESMAAGTPPIVTPVGGSPEVVGGLSPDLIVPDWTPAALSAGLTAAFRGELKLPSAEQCKAFARANFDWTTATRKVLAVYQEAISASQPEAA